MPTDVDEARVRGRRSTGPRASQLAAMDEAVPRHRHARWPRRPACGRCSITAGGGFLGRVNQGNVYVRIAPHEERTFSPRAAAGTETLRGEPLARLPRQLHPARRDAGGPRRSCASSATCRILVRNIPAFNIGGGSFDIDFVLRGPDLEALAAYAEELRTRAIASWAASSTPTPR